MQVRALAPFVDESGRHSPGDMFPMAEELAVLRIKAGLVQRVASEPEMAVQREPDGIGINDRAACLLCPGTFSSARKSDC